MRMRCLRSLPARFRALRRKLPTQDVKDSPQKRAGVCGLTRLSRRQSLGFLFYRGNRGSSWPLDGMERQFASRSGFPAQRWRENVVAEGTPEAPGILSMQGQGNLNRSALYFG